MLELTSKWDPEDAQTRVLRGFHELVSRAYPNLRMLRGIIYTENDIAKCLMNSQQGLLGNDANSLAESELELFSFIQSNNRGGVRTTLKGLLERFERKPYGWYYAAVLCTLANLCARGKVEVRAGRQPAGRGRTGTDAAQHPWPRQCGAGTPGRIYRVSGPRPQGVL
ncbi:MAG: hypothetical protein IPJ05_03025 [Nitrosomonas sp.]|nr:hypothetical protein [Nitrosomonas sp.]